MLINITYRRSLKSAKVHVIYSSTILNKDGIEHISEDISEHKDCRVTHTGDSLAFVKAESPDEIPLDSTNIIALYPKAHTILKFED